MRPRASLAARLAGPDSLNLTRTLASGQAFRWTWSRSGDGAVVAAGIVGRRAVRLRQDGDGIWLLAPEGAGARGHLRRYFGFAPASRRVRRIEAALARDAVLARVLPHTHGVGILSQDPWEVLISFIISANNNIPKICRSIGRLARALGDPLGNDAFAFPTPARLAGAHRQTLARCLLGYRAPYVRAAARLVATGEVRLDALSRMPLGEARARLLRLPGVGEKVADCVLLFGLGHTGAFPVDVWVHRAVERLYFRGRSRTVRQIQAFAEARFGALAGYAQQHLFCYARAYLRPSRTARGRSRRGPGASDLSVPSPAI